MPIMSSGWSYISHLGHLICRGIARTYFRGGGGDRGSFLVWRRVSEGDVSPSEALRFWTFYTEFVQFGEYFLEAKLTQPFPFLFFLSHPIPFLFPHLSFSSFPLFLFLLSFFPSLSFLFPLFPFLSLCPFPISSPLPNF